MPRTATKTPAPDDTIPPAADEAPPAAEAPKLVRVQCIAHNGPWDHSGPMAFYEVREVPAEVAAILQENKQVVVLG